MSKDLVDRLRTHVASRGGPTLNSAWQMMADAADRIEELETVCGELYQVVGVLSSKHDDCFDHPDVIKALDNASDNALTHKDLLPFPSTPLPGIVF